MHFSDIKPGFSSPKTVETARGMAPYSIEKAKGLLKAAVPDALRDAARDELSFVLGLDRRKANNMHASNLAVCTKLIGAFIDVMLRVWDQGCGRQLHFVTITPDRWHMDLRCPEIDLTASREQASRWMRRLGIVGLGFIEFGPFVNHPHVANGRLIAQHLHIVGYPIDPFRYPEKLAALKQSEGSNRLGFPVVVDKRIRLTDQDVAMVAFYCRKPVYQATKVVPSTSHPGKHKLRKAPLTRRMALRIAEVLSYLTFQDTVITHKSGWLWRQEMFKSLGPIGWRHDNPGLSFTELDKLWAKVWRAAGKVPFERVTVHR